MSRYIDADLFIKVFDDGEKKMDALSFAIPHEVREATKSIYCEIRNIVNDIPTADVRENVKGEWIEDGALTKCSVCGNTSEFCGTENFCYNCGADMRSRLQGTEIDGMYIDISGDGTVIEQICEVKYERTD